MGLDGALTAAPHDEGEPEGIGWPSVLDRVAARVRQRLAVEQSTPDDVGEGGHQASLIRLLPL